MTRLIDADALKEKVDKFIGYLDEDMICRIKIVIDNAPTIEDHSLEIAQKSINLGIEYGKLEGRIESKKSKGKWIEMLCSDGYECSECGYVDYYYFEHNFCSNCGADMRGEEADMEGKEND